MTRPHESDTLLGTRGLISVLTFTDSIHASDSTLFLYGHYGAFCYMTSSWEWNSLRAFVFPNTCNWTVFINQVNICNISSLETVLYKQENENVFVLKKLCRHTEIMQTQKNIFLYSWLRLCIAANRKKQLIWISSNNKIQ